MNENIHAVKEVQPQGCKLGGEIKGIQKIFQLRVTSDLIGTRKIMTRRISCWCWKCDIGKFDDCLEQSGWSIIDLKEVQKRNKSEENDGYSGDDNEDKTNLEDVERLVIRLPQLPQQLKVLLGICLV